MSNLEFGKDFDFNQIGKRNTSKHLLKSYGVDIEAARVLDELQKSEGARGGKVIGHTKSGKSIYLAKHKEEHKKVHKNFDIQEHRQAASLLENKVKELEGKADPSAHRDAAIYKEHAGWHSEHMRTLKKGDPNPDPKEFKQGKVVGEHETGTSDPIDEIEEEDDAEERMDDRNISQNKKRVEKADQDDGDSIYMSKAENEEQKAKMKKVMDEFKSGKLKSGSGAKVTERAQAIAIAMSEAGLNKSHKESDETRDFQDLENKKILTDFDADNKEEDREEGESAVHKAFDVLGVDLIEKGKRAQFGEIRTWNGKKMKKTAEGWVPVKGEGHENHEEHEQHQGHENSEKSISKSIKALSKKSDSFRDWSKDKSWDEIYKTCPKGEWLLELFAKANPKDLQTLTLAKGHCANTVRHLMTDKRSLKAIDTAIAFGEGKATLEELDSAYSAAAAAATYAARTAYDPAANAAANAAAYAARTAYDPVADSAHVVAYSAIRAADAVYADAGAADSARIENQQETADIVRKYIPINKFTNAKRV